MYFLYYFHILEIENIMIIRSHVYFMVIVDGFFYDINVGVSCLTKKKKMLGFVSYVFLFGFPNKTWIVLKL